MRSFALIWALGAAAAAVEQSVAAVEQSAAARREQKRAESGGCAPRPTLREYLSVAASRVERGGQAAVDIVAVAHAASAPCQPGGEPSTGPSAPGECSLSVTAAGNGPDRPPPM